jgi:3-hydroxyacyl-CoA dehydrogenase
VSRLIIRKVAVLGAGVMGAQIAAHCANAGVPVILFDLPAKEGDPSGIAKKAVDGLKKLEPAPLATKDRAQFIDVANYGSDLDSCATATSSSRPSPRRWSGSSTSTPRSPFIRPDAIFASNTSGLSINALSEGMPAEPAPASAASTSSTRRATWRWSN